MELTLTALLVIVLLGYIGAIVALLYAKENYKQALMPGTVAWIIVVVFSWCITIEVMVLMGGSFVLGILAQLVIARK